MKNILTQTIIFGPPYNSPHDGGKVKGGVSKCRETSVKNILARGGIEFLAVLLGISGSLWIDDSSTNRNDRTEEYEAYSRLSNALEQDIKNLEKALIDIQIANRNG